ncbi:tyrosyl-DNA phosphodiesterase 1-like isoform X3 [Dreissena polymorpha]|uniref:tyrosyl-DNA phosphodiesterase 1-like isoform X3 n=1 Tax=Dreissena polymorpha TaxID=45954 RepID=UPI00226524E8|nr:tyrosyl-DNA phosphodiesterase 1-like isoform X3 [Dreissena polymorpha]
MDKNILRRMSDSDTTRGSDGDETLPPSDKEDRCRSPDLFDEPDPSARSLPLHKRQSLAHELSDSESDVECSRKSNGNDAERRAFIKEFLTMTDSDSEDDTNKKHKTDENKMKKVGSQKQNHMQSLNNDEHKSQLSFSSVSDKPYKQNYSKPFSDTNSKETDFLSVEVKHKHNQSSGLNKKSDLRLQLSNTNESAKQKNHTSSNVEGSTPKIGSARKQTRTSESDKALSTSPGSSGQKRKRSRSPVPHELRKAATEILSKISEKPTTSKKQCQYGSKCYRKNPSHFEEYSHPGEADKAINSTPPTKKLKRVSDSPVARKSPISAHLSPASSTPLSIAQSKSDAKGMISSSTALKQKVNDQQPSTSAASSSLSSKSPSKSNVKTQNELTPVSKFKECDQKQSTSKAKVKKRSSIVNPKTVSEKLEQAQPYSFFLNRVVGLDGKYNSAFVLDIKDILSEEMGNLTASCQFNYMFDIPWLIKQYPAVFRKKPLMIVHGEQGASNTALQAQAMAYDNIRFCQAKLEIMYGTHHTKMMLLLYEDGLRVVIHTSNLIEQDWHQKTQGSWVSPKFPKLQTPGRDKGESPTFFKQDLLNYLAAYKAYQLKDWMEHIVNHDMSSARVVILGSVPGRHQGERQKAMWGHLKLRHALQQHGPSHSLVKTWPVIGQFSSIGSLGPNQDNWLCKEWLHSLSATKAGTGVPSNGRLQLVFPTVDNVRLSLEGFPAGGSIPYSVNTAKKQTWLHNFFHVWRSEGRGRSRAMPHIKTYVRPMQQGSSAAWFAVTSANLSKAAWGALEKQGTQLMIRSYEIGVLFLPKFFDDEETFAVTSDIETAIKEGSFPLPYDLPVTLYDKRDRPWMWDIPYMNLPDTNGNVWCPFSK